MSSSPRPQLSLIFSSKQSYLKHIFACVIESSSPFCHLKEWENRSCARCIRWKHRIENFALDSCLLRFRTKDNPNIYTFSAMTCLSAIQWSPNPNPRSRLSRVAVVFCSSLYPIISEPCITPQILHKVLRPRAPCHNLPVCTLIFFSFTLQF